MVESYPAPPWNMVGQLWLSLFRVSEPVDEQRPKGMYGVALVSYEPGSPLTYSELLVARVADKPHKGVTVTDIWVDSPASMAGGRELWAIPKELADFTLKRNEGRLVDRAQWSVSAEARQLAAARFRDTSRVAVRLPFSGDTVQPRDGDWVTASLTGSSRALPCLGSWEFAADGPLSWLAGRRPLLSVRMRDFRMSFG
ncbi:acetoacetate decarboxylase family protein [Nocardioides sp. Kera G14]|uniref:acetoacetate decarboxylase family protein n=1 Tax=Nocardioides sp. Kera G14 TaxID=2884264 RepID=UPI001D11E567|nr:acetoacetate decarboxylase family protein [Nocardioides sp. Kera G14]UDY24712.1 acetoacetate decarboxylase family protein [Nocardioides sp. Kera G14]